MFKYLPGKNLDFTSQTKFEFFCDGLMGCRQGNALTGQFYVVNEGPALKAVQAKFPNVDIKAIQDDITIFGDPENFFDEADDEGEVKKLGALSLLIQELKACGLDCNKIKFACRDNARRLRKEAIVAEGAPVNLGT